MKKITFIISLLLAGIGALAQQPVKHIDSPARGAQLDGKTIAMWNSHGAYFNADRGEWIFQRAPLNTTVEDVFTSAFVLDFVAPMLENAGAWVMLPRERDTSTTEIIIDADSRLTPGYAELPGSHQWQQSPRGFGYKQGGYGNGENPMAMGKSRVIEAAGSSNGVAKATWSAEIPRDGVYTIYVSYPRLENASSAVTYVVNSARGEERVVVNQTMGAGTWMRLGEFPLAAGQSSLPIVTLTNQSTDHAGKVGGADAVKIGGGMGSVMRASDKSKGKTTAQEPKVSGYPRWLEGARYNLQYAGFPASVYSPAESETDYTDDIRCRPLWVNYLSGGSARNPKAPGLNIPIDLALALHTDAGTTPDTTIVGTLGIYSTNGGAKLADGRRRTVNKQLTEAVVDQIVNDVRTLYQPGWTKRKLRDRRYAEARYADVPSALIEMFSHQNFADMQLGLDPQFQFDVSRAIYKGIARFLAGENRKSVVIQPLPVNSMALQRTADKGSYKLTWRSTTDPLEPSARPTEYIIEERVGSHGAFRPIATVSTPSYTISHVPAGEMRSYRVIARNEGGVSFPSEVVALGWFDNHRPEALIVNGFTRIGRPASFDDGENAGFRADIDNGVAYGRSVAFIGNQYDFDRASEWVSDDENPGHGASTKEYIGKMLAGNTMDYAAQHGEGFMAAEQSFVSTSAQDFLERPDHYNQPIVDLILGKQRSSLRGNVDSTYHYQPFPPAMVNRLSAFISRGGNVMISGAYIGSELNGSPVDSIARQLSRFGKVELGLADALPETNKVTGATTQHFWSLPQCVKLPLSVKPNSEIYMLGELETVTPTVNAATKSDGDYVEEIALYDNGRVAAYALHRKEKGDIVMATFPIEVITDPAARNQFVAGMLKFLDVVRLPISQHCDIPLPKIDPIPVKSPELPKPSTPAGAGY
ncbi:MAG: N-acetylmuramoyl-L-alanine amidase [Muribaculaceae bacterium]|nr:N-acetylmuramoyl-L-alanine amidase [Muribaculaceae bacterium]